MFFSLAFIQRALQARFGLSLGVSSQWQLCPMFIGTSAIYSILTWRCLWAIVVPVSLSGLTRSIMSAHFVIENKRLKWFRRIPVGQDLPRWIRETLFSFPGNGSYSCRFPEMVFGFSELFYECFAPWPEPFCENARVSEIFESFRRCE